MLKFGDGPTSSEFDYIVVGAGSAGCVLAYRLTEDPERSLLLLEAGGEDASPFIRVPAGLLQIRSKYTWRMDAEPDHSRRGLIDQWSAGRVIGGSSSINGQIWTRGDPDDFDEWAAGGAVGWDYNSVLPYFRRIETFSEGPDQYRGGAGPLHVGYPRVAHVTTEAFIGAALQHRIPFNPDYNSGVQEGVGYSQVSQRRGWRHSTARAYLAPARRRRNLTLRKHSTACRVLLRGQRAVGVEYKAGGKVHQAHARCEVIVCAGALLSPHLLMLSGIGPTDHLREHGIAVAVSSPGVGANLQEHFGTRLVYSVNLPTLNMELTPRGIARHGLDFAFRGRGAVTSPPTHAMVFGKLQADDRASSYELCFLPLGLEAASVDAEQRFASSDPSTMKPSKEPLVSVVAHMSYPRARGTVMLRSADPEMMPVIRHELFGSRADVATQIEVARHARELFAEPALAVHVTGEVAPGHSVQSDDEWEEYIRVSSARGHHPIGTCRMGTDPSAVVDPELRVHGTEALRVVDASVMPTLISGHTNAPVIMIAERASDLIRAEFVAQQTGG